MNTVKIENFNNLFIVADICHPRYAVVRKSQKDLFDCILQYRKFATIYDLPLITHEMPKSIFEQYMFELINNNTL